MAWNPISLVGDMFNPNYQQEDRRRPENRLKRIVFDSDRRDESRVRTWLELSKHLVDIEKRDAPGEDDDDSMLKAA